MQTNLNRLVELLTRLDLNRMSSIRNQQRLFYLKVFLILMKLIFLLYGNLIILSSNSTANVDATRPTRNIVKNFIFSNIFEISF